LDQDLTKAFQSLDLFKDLSQEDMTKFLTHCREEIVDPQSVIFREDDSPDRFYILLEGQVEIWKDFDTPFADVLAIRGPGATFGEMSLIDELPRSATVKTTTRCRLVSLDKPHFRGVIEKNPSIALLIMKAVSHMVRVSNETFQSGLRQKNLMLETAYDELKRTQAELIRSERLSTLGQFSSMIIHDLRNPLSIVKGYAEIICLGSQGNERQALMATKLLAEAERLNRMLGELLDYSRGNIRLNLAPVHLDSLFATLGEEIKESCLRHSIRVELLNEVTEPLLVDVDRLHRVFTNLIDNARKAMKNGGVLTLKANLYDDLVAIQIIDTGEGMDEFTRSHLFEPFFSASSSGGTGLGMIVVANVVEAHRGTITVESQRGKGTTIHLKLPLHPRSSE